MDEQQSGPVGHVEDAQSEHTGMSAVDDVLHQVARLAEVPVPEHVAVFERAHDQLRRALDARQDA